MKSGYRSFFVCVAVLLLVGSTAAASGLATTGVGARALSMGGAFRAIADDWSAAYWNPAGLTQLQENQLDVTLLVVDPRPAYTPSAGADLQGTGFSLKTGERYPEDRPLPYPTFSGFVQLPSVEGLTIGAALYWAHDANYLWDLYRTHDWYNETFILTESEHRMDLDVWDFHPTAAMELTDKLSAGVGLSVQRGDLVFKRIHLFENVWGSPQDVFPYNWFIGEMDFDGNGYGIGANAGLLYKYDEKTTIGLTGQTPVTVGMSGISNLWLIFPDNGGLGGPEADTTYNDYYEGGYHSDRTPFDLDLKLPGSLAFGVAYKANDQWTLALDVVRTFWSQMDEWRFKFNDGGHELHMRDLAPIEEYVMPLNYEDQMTVSLGAEYLLNENWIIRGGYCFDQTAVPDETLKPYLPDYGSRHGLSGGVSLLLEKWELSGRLNASFSGTRTIDELMDVNDDGQFDNFPGEYTQNKFEFLISTKYRF
jgi:long-chain fatty acid transport protein